MRVLSVWVIEFIKLFGRRRLHQLNAECPICHQWSGCITITLVGNIYSTMPVNTRGRYSKDLATAGTIRRSSCVLVQAPLRDSILARTKNSISTHQKSP